MQNAQKCITSNTESRELCNKQIQNNAQNYVQITQNEHVIFSVSVI